MDLGTLAQAVTIAIAALVYTSVRVDPLPRQSAPIAEPAPKLDSKTAIRNQIRLSWPCIVWLPEPKLT
jgi:hypothetical protein